MTLPAVAERAGLPLAEVEAVMRSPQELLRKLVVGVVAAPTENIDAAVAAAPDANAALEAFLRQFIQYFSDNLDEFRTHMRMQTREIAELVRLNEGEEGREIVDVTGRLFARVEEKLVAEWGTADLPTGIHPRRLVFVAYVAALGLLSFKAMLDATGRTMKHDDESLITELSQALASPTKVLRQLAALNDVSAELAAMRSEEELVRRVPQMLCDALDVEQAFLALQNRDGAMSLTSIASRRHDDSTVARWLTFAKNGTFRPPPQVGRCVRDRRTVFARQPASDPDWPRHDDADVQREYEQFHPNAPFVATPVYCQGDVVGLVSAHSSVEGRTIDVRDVARVETFATLVGLTLETVRFTATLNAKVDERTRELRDAQAALVQSEKMASLGHLVAGVAHELNSPLGALHGAQDAMGRALAKLEAELGSLAPEVLDGNRNLARALAALRGSADVVAQGCERVGGVVGRLKTFARLDQGEVQRACINGCVEDALGLMAEHLVNVELTKDFAELPKVLCSPGQLNQAFFNVAMNAVQAMPRGGTLRVVTRCEGDELSVKWCDDGEGIPADNLHRVFDPGFTTRGVGVGAGLGLAICHQVVRRHSGRIEVTSEVGAGTQVEIRLPITDHVPAGMVR